MAGQVQVHGPRRVVVLINRDTLQQLFFAIAIALVVSYFYTSFFFPNYGSNDVLIFRAAFMIHYGPHFINDRIFRRFIMDRILLMTGFFKKGPDSWS
jgi:hypothetical protein